MKINQILILLIMICFPFTVLDIQFNDERLELANSENVDYVSTPTIGIPFAHEPALQNPLIFPDDYTYSVMGNSTFMTASVGYSSDPIGLENEEFRSSFYRRNATNYSYFYDSLDGYEPGWIYDTQLLARTSPEKDSSLLIGFVPCNRQVVPDAWRYTNYANYGDSFCYNDNTSSWGAILEIFSASTINTSYQKLGTLSYENCGWTGGGYQSTTGYWRKIVTGYIDDFKIVENSSGGFELLVSHRHVSNPDSGSDECDVMFNGTKIGNLPSNNNMVLDLIQVDRNGNASFDRVATSSSTNRIEFTLNDNVMSYTTIPEYGVECYDYVNQTSIGTIPDILIYGQRTASNSDFVLYAETGSGLLGHGIINTNSCQVIYSQNQFMFWSNHQESPFLWQDNYGIHHIFAVNTYSYDTNEDIPPFNYSIPLGEWYHAEIFSNGSIKSISKNTLTGGDTPDSKTSGIGSFQDSNHDYYLLDGDRDGHPNLFDVFPSDSTEWEDTDLDGYGDNRDACETQSGTSTIDREGCPDADGDGVSNQNDAFILDSTQQYDSDIDGYGDNQSGNQPDSCTNEAGGSYRDRFGCKDTDLDGQSDLNDFLEFEPTQWNDTDGDGFGDNLYGFQGDSCIFDAGSSFANKFGCPDQDLDGWSDDEDDLPSNPTQWIDRDGDGYGENTSIGAIDSDAFPSDGTQWNDTDGDGHGDNPFGTEGDWFPNDPTRWQDSDRDGVADEDDAFPNEKSQTMDTDGDGYGDDANGSNPDAFPNDSEEWSDTDGDGIGNNADAFPFDPSQQTDSDGDGFGDNERGSGADKFPSDSTQWADIDGDGYGDNAEGTNPDAFITDPTQWADTDGDGYGDNPTGRLADAFIEDATQWIDEDDDGFGDNQSGNNPDPFLFDFDNDGYNDSIDPLPKLASPGDLDNDGVLDEEDMFPEDFREWADNDGDGVGDNADTDDDNDGWSDADELRDGTDPFSSSEQPVDSFEIVIPGTAVGLGAWDLIGIFGGVPLFAWIGFGFITRNGRTAKYEEKLRAANTRDELESVARQWEYSLMLRMLGPHQGIRLERLRAELDDVFERQNQTLSSLEQSEYNQTQLVQEEMNQNEKEVPEINLKPDIDAVGNPDENGYEWITSEDGKNWYRTQGSKDDWVEFSN